MTNPRCRSRSPARTLWDQHGSLAIMVLVAVMAFQTGREWQTWQTADSLHSLIQAQSTKQELMASQLQELATKYDQLSARVAAATKEVSEAATKVEAITADNPNGKKTEALPQP